MACNGDDTELEGKINHWCNVSGEKAWLTLQKGKPMRGAPSTVWWGEPHALPARLSWLTSALLPVNGKGQPDSAMRLRQFNLCPWIMDIPSEWRPIYVLYHASPPPIYFGWGYDLIAGGSIDDGPPDLYTEVKQGHQLGRLARTDMPNVLSPVVYDWLSVLPRLSFLPSPPFCSPLRWLPDTRQ